MAANLDDFLTYIEFEKVQRDRLTTFPGLVGFYEARQQGDNAADSARRFFDYFRASFGQCTVVSSLTDLEVAVDFWNGEGLSVRERLVEQNWITLGKNNEEALGDFCLTSVGSAQIPLLEELCLLHFQFLTYGYLFLYWEQNGLVAYPTKDSGFGFIARRETEGFLSAHEFLSSLSDDDRFTVELKTTP
jgi:hypothetical protein